LCPEYEGLELGIGESLLLKAIAESTGREMKKIKADYAEIGDLGVIAMVCSRNAGVHGFNFIHGHRLISPCKEIG
jgi:hypothetical protein